VLGLAKTLDGVDVSTKAIEKVVFGLQRNFGLKTETGDEIYIAPLRGYNKNPVFSSNSYPRRSE